MLPDSASLHGMLTLAEPPEAQLEGSSLGWLYNPVFVVDALGNRCRAWTAFAGGGMWVLEDRFGAEDPFEFWLYEREDLFELLSELAAHGTARHGGAQPTALEGLTDPSREAFTEAHEMWLWYRVVKSRHEALGRWPASFKELTALLTNAHPQTPVSVTDAADFLETLRQLAFRRFAGDSAPA